MKKKPNITLDGTEINVYANIGNAGDVGLVLQNDADGIGLFRSECIYLDAQEFPTEEQHHPAILKMIRQTIEADHRHGSWVGICGELGGDLTLTEEFPRMGVDELSVSPSAVLPLRKQKKPGPRVKAVISVSPCPNSPGK